MHYKSEINELEFFKSKSILIIGACGTIGKNLATKLLDFKPARLRLLDVDDTALTELSDELSLKDEAGSLRFLYGNIRDKERLIRSFEDIDYVFHCAAIKHVNIGEYNPREVVLTNIIGTQNVIDAALHNCVKKVIFTSSDKAVNPTNTMGASKLVGEKLFIAANNIRGSRDTIFAVVRFGNVLGSRGSIIPRFKKRIKKGLDLIVTDPEMTRFMMPTQDAVNLLIKSMILSKGGEIFVLKMPTLILKDLVELFQEYAWLSSGTKSQIKITGILPGEKNYEELMTDEEARRSIEVDDMYVVIPNIKEIQKWYEPSIMKQLGKINTRVYNSRFTKALTKIELSKMLNKFRIFEEV